MSEIVVCALYKFVTLENFEDLRKPILNAMLDNGVHGTLLLAQEGINGTVAGSRRGIDEVLAFLRNEPRLANLDSKESLTDEMPFKRTKVKLKKEIVTMGVVGIDPNQVVGTYVEPEDWNALISDPDVLLIDTRNDYEYQVGTFKNAINPKTDSFRQFPAYIEDHVLPRKPKKVAMFCTGGIRCEKSTAYLKERGIDEVFHLKGGILKYLEKVEEADTLWEGECFVFDDRVTVNHKLERGDYDQCYACRLPITETDKASDKYQPGVSCPSCFDHISEDKRSRFEERERQIQLSKQRGESHMGGDVAQRIEHRRLEKLAARQHSRDS